jgi:hypothetical protein
VTSEVDFAASPMAAAPAADAPLDPARPTPNANRADKTIIRIDISPSMSL